MIYGMDAKQAYEFAQERFNSSDPKDAVQGFPVLCEIYLETKERQYLDEILEKYKDAAEKEHIPIGFDNMTTVLVAQKNCEQFRDFQSRLSEEDSLYTRSYITGKTPKELQKEDEDAARAAEEKRKRAEAWSAQGLCRYCGGQLGLFKKCKSCGNKN